MSFFITLGDIVNLTFAVLILMVVAMFGARDAWKKYRCKHEQFFENRACDAVCSKCGKNLGFIGPLREKRSKP